MPNLKAFISSTCYDLSMAREQLRSFLISLGIDPIMSEYSDILYDPRKHTHTSCLQEVPNTDIVILIIGSRFGGKIVPDALIDVDLDKIRQASYDIGVIDEVDNLSITQLEVLKAIEKQIPVFVFVDEKVMHEQHVYEKNKDIVDKIKFPSIDKSETAKYIFEFINFLRNRIKGNSVISFSKIEDIEIHLRKQFSSLLQRLLREQRENDIESQKMFKLSEQLEDLKTAIISSIGNSDSRDVARGVLKYRRLIDFLTGLRVSDTKIIIESQMSFQEILDEMDIVNILSLEGRNRYGRSVLVKSDKTFYELRYPTEFLKEIEMDWSNFKALPSDTRKIIYEALDDMRRMGISVLRYRDTNVEEYLEEINEKESSQLTFDDSES